MDESHLAEGMAVVDHLRSLRPDLFVDSDRMRLENIGSDDSLVDVSVVFDDPRD